MAYNEDSSGSGHDEPWIQWFCGLKGHEMFCEVERSYIEDGFNLYGLRACVSNFSDCLDLILDRIGPDDSDDSHLTQSAFTLFGLIHARYIVTAHGLDAMYNKYAAKEFGTCPLVQCQGQPVLPLGLKDEVGYDTVKIFCPKCQSVYHPPPPRRGGGTGAIDGASFGTTFAHLFLMTFSNLVPDPRSPDSVYVPRIFGFRVHPSARQRPSSGNAPLCQSTGSNPTNARNGRGNGSAAAAPGGANAVPVAGDVKITSSKGNLPQQNDEGLPFEDSTPKISAASVQEQAAKASGVSDALDNSGKNGSKIAAPGGGAEGKEDAASPGKFNDDDSKDLSQRQDGSDGNTGKSTQGQAKRRSRNNNIPSPLPAEENGNPGDLSSLKQSKRQKRQSSAIGT